ncbi:type II secretion system F family protein [Corynebacterium sp. 335C]
MTAAAAAAALAALAVLAWPPDPVRRLGRAGRGRAAIDARWWPALALPALPLIGAHGALAAAILARTVLAVVRHVRARAAADREQAAVGRAAGTLAAQLRAGSPAPAALEQAGADAGGEIGDAVRAAAARARLGGSAADALAAAGHPALSGLVAAWRVAESRGIPLADIADGVRDDAAGRRAHRSRAAASLAGPRTTMMILAALPLAGVAMGQALGAAPLAFLGGGGLGGIVLVAGVAFTGAGVAWSLRILESAEVAP